jgi:hypothetical protein
VNLYDVNQVGAAPTGVGARRRLRAAMELDESENFDAILTNSLYALEHESLIGVIAVRQSRES